jgi:hypothetical protein
MNLKQIEVSVLHRSSRNPKILIEMSVSTAKKIVDGHQNLNSVMRNQVKTAIEFAANGIPPTEEPS